MSASLFDLTSASVEGLLDALARFGRRALGGVDPHAMMSEATEIVAAQLDVEFCSVWELLPDHSLLLRAGVGWEAGRVGKQVEQNNSTPASRVILSQEPILIENLDSDSRFAEPSLLGDHGVVSSLNVPILGPARLYGVLGAHTAAVRKFRPVEVTAMQLIANALSTVFVCRGHEYQERHRHLLRAEQMMALGQVAAGLAHELRNPLTSIKGLIQVNRREMQDRGLPTDDFQIIEQEIRRMERSLKTFLDFARPPRPERRPLTLAPLIDRVAMLVKGRAKKQRVAIESAAHDTAVWVNADADQIQQLLLNLLLNALDAMPRGGTVTIERGPPVAGMVSVTVRDTGPGIAPHILPVVFETFVSGKETGVGLGLPVSRRIAEDHDGTLTAANLPEGGASFVLTLPLLRVGPPTDVGG
jgi:signal transduction histidine kinase